MTAVVDERVDQKNLQDDTLGAGTADQETTQPADTLPSSSPPPPDEDENENITVAPSSTISEVLAETPSEDPAGHDPAQVDKEHQVETVHTSDLVRADTEDMVLDAEHDPAGGQADDGQDWLAEVQDPDMKRVKVYELVGQRWVDQGTAFCFGQFQEDAEHAHLIARSERNYADVILSTPIRANDVYQRQQDTLIVWTEPNGADYALSFQDPEGCLEVWNFICEVQQHMAAVDEQTLVSSSPNIGPEPSITSASIQRSGQLPTPQIGNIVDIDRAIKGFSRQSQIKERLCEYIMQEDYFKGLIDVLQTAEDLESMDNLHALCNVTHTILSLNDHNLYEYILADDLFPGVVGMLEYDPDFPNYKANYREFLSRTTKFHEPIPIQDVSLQRKIHHTYRLMFLKDVVLARTLDDSTFNVLNSCIIFNQIDIITHVQQDLFFLRDVVKLFVDEDILSSPTGPRRISGPQPAVNGSGPTDTDKLPPNELPSSNGITPTPPPKRSAYYAYAPRPDLSEDEIHHRRQVILMLQHLCATAKNVQLPARMALFRSLVDRGVLFGVQWALGFALSVPSAQADPYAAAISAAGEVLGALLDHDAYGVRGHVLKQVVAIETERGKGKTGADKAETLAELVCGIVARSGSVAVQSQIGDALKVLLDIPPPGDVGPPLPTSEAMPGGIRNQRKDEPGTERFMDYFYRDCVNILFKPVMELPEWKNSTDPVLQLSREETNRFTYLCDLLYNFISGHNFRGYFYVASSQILARVPTLFKARDKHLQHAAFRIFRLLLKLNNANLHTQVMKHDVLKPILDLTYRESRRDNLLSCSCHEYFDFMRRENIKDLIKFCMTQHEEDIRKLAETPLGSERFQLFIRRWEINNEPPPEEPKTEKPQDNRWPGQVRALDAEEEDYFNTEEDEDDYIPPISQQQWVRSLGSGRGSPLPSLKRKRRIGAMASVLGVIQANLAPRAPSPSLGQLVDYADDDDDLTAIDRDLLLAGTSAAGSQPGADTSSSNGPPPQKRPADDDEDNLLESLVRPKVQPQPRPGAVRLGEKRRRGDGDDDDEILERLTKAKKPDLGADKGAASGPLAARSTKVGDDPPFKKLKLKFGLGSSALSSSSPTTPSPDSKNGAKDGDTG